MLAAEETYPSTRLFSPIPRCFRTARYIIRPQIPSIRLRTCLSIPSSIRPSSLACVRSESLTRDFGVTFRKIMIPGSSRHEIRCWLPRRLTLPPGYSHRSLVVSAPPAILSVHKFPVSLIESIHITFICFCRAPASSHCCLVVITSHLVVVSLSSRRLFVVSLSSLCYHCHHPCRPRPC